MASANFLEEALSNDVDESAVYAIVGSLENQLITPVSSVSTQNNVVINDQDQQNNITSENAAVLQKFVSEQNITGDITIVSGDNCLNTSLNTISYNNVQIPQQPTFVSSVSNISQANLTSATNFNDQIKVVYTHAAPTGRLTFPAQGLPNGSLGLTSPLSQNILHTVPAGSIVTQAVNKPITMQPPLVIKQTPGGQVGMQAGMVTVPMTVNSSIPGPIPNVMTLTKSGGGNVVATSQNLGGAAPSALIPNVQILNMRATTPGVATQKSVATVSPRVVIGAPQVVGTRAAAPGITLQTLQGLQPGQQGHLLLKTENGQYQLLRVGPAPAPNALTAPQAQAIRLSSVPAHPGVATVSTSIATAPPLPLAPLASSMATVPAPQSQPPTVTTQKPSDNTKEKCRNFLANLLDLSSKEPKSVERNVRNLIQELIDAQVEPEEFCDRLERLLNASPQPCLIGFLKKSLPLLRQSLVTKELVIEGISPPAAHIAFSTVPTPVQNAMVSGNMQMSRLQVMPKNNAVGQKQGGNIAVLQNIPIQAPKVLNKGGNQKLGNKANFSRAMTTASLNTVLTPGKSLLKDKEKKASLYSQPFADDKIAGDDDINDVAAMGGVNLAEETQRILGSTEMIGTQIRSCKDEYLVPMSALQIRLNFIVSKHGLEEPSHEIAALMSHAVQERLKNLLEKLAVIAQHRIDLITKSDNRFDITQDVKGQLKFLEELDRVDKKRREDSEREMLLRAAKSRSKNEDPEQAKLKAKAKEMQRAELEELRQREANLTALQAIGPRKKSRFDGPGGNDTTSTSSSQGQPYSSRSQMALRSRLKRINQRDILFLLEQDKDTAHSRMLYCSYLN